MFLKQRAPLECQRPVLVVAAGNSLARERRPGRLAGKDFIGYTVTVNCNKRLGAWHGPCGQASMTQKVTLQSLADQVEALRRALLNQPRMHVKDVLRRYGFSKATLYRRIQDRRFPRPRRFTGPLWRLEDLEQAEAAGQLHRPMSR
jgi:predicted DNA-binding transcriptional regulator AlpA